MSTELVRLDDEVGQAIRRPRQLGVPLITGSAAVIEDWALATRELPQSGTYATAESGTAPGRSARLAVMSRAATASPAFQPGARPRLGGLIADTVTPLRANTHEATEFEFHISPASSSSRPQTGVGMDGRRSITRRA